VDPGARQTAAQLGDREVRRGRDKRMYPLNVTRHDGALPAAVSLRLTMPLRRQRCISLITKLTLTSNRRAVARRGSPSPNGPYCPFAQVHRIWSCHPSLASIPSSQLGSQQPHVVNPYSIPAIRIPL
jgi:hypothetical protein